MSRARGRRLLERGKTLLIALLSLSAIFLAARTGLFAQLFSASPFLSGAAGYISSLLSGGSGTAADGAGQSYLRPFLPECVSVSTSAGRYGERHGESAVRAVYERFSAALGEALGSSGEPETLDEAAWRRAIEGDGVYFDFGCPRPLSILAAGLGTSMASPAGADASRRLCLSEEDGELYIYYIRETDGGFFRCATALKGEAIARRLEEFPPNGAYFAYEGGEALSLLSPWALLGCRAPELSALGVKNPFSGALTAAELMEDFEMNPFVATRYNEADGTVVMIDGDMTLRADSAGVVIFRQNGAGRLLAAGDGSTEAAELASKLVQAVADRLGGAAELVLRGAAYEDGAWVLRFDYMCQGLAIRLFDGESGAEVRVENGAVAYARLNLRQYSLSGGSVAPLPDRQAAAIVQAQGGGEPELVFADMGESVECDWVRAR